MIGHPAKTINYSARENVLQVEITPDISVNHYSQLWRIKNCLNALIELDG